MLNYNKLFALDSFSLPIKKKDKFFFSNIKKLSNFHYRNSNEFKLISDRLFKSISKIKNIYDLPFLHVSLFKNFDLISKKKDLKKLSTFKSSGTSNTKKSKIHLDYKTAILQSKALKKIFLNIVNKDTDIFFLENKNFLNSKEIMSAKGAAVKGFGQLCRKKNFLLDKNNKLDLTVLRKYIQKHKNNKFVIFGFTSSIWFNLINEMKKRNIKLKKNSGIIIHGGGWKKMVKHKVSNSKFKDNAKNFLGVRHIYNYYGMIEQTGSVFLECEKGYFHCSLFSDILIRNAKLELCKINEPGLIQTLSLLPVSYPGQSLLTEDIGIIHGVDNCKCGILGKYFTVLGRVPDAELRGCSDTN
jgi:hypothetical protein